MVKQSVLANNRLPGWIGKAGDKLYAFSGKFYKGKRE